MIRHRFFLTILSLALTAGPIKVFSAEPDMADTRRPAVQNNHAAIRHHSEPNARTSRDYALAAEINRIRKHAETIREKEDDATQKIVSLLENETEALGSAGKKSPKPTKRKPQTADLTKEALLRSLLAQSLLDYYRESGSGIREPDFSPSDTEKTDVTQADYHNLSSWRRNDFIREILYQTGLSCRIPFPEPDKDLLYDPENGWAVFDSNRNTYRPDLREILCYRAWNLLEEMESAGLLQATERIESLYHLIGEHINTVSDPDSAQARLDLELRYLHYRFENGLCDEQTYKTVLHDLARRYENLPNAGDAFYLLAWQERSRNPFVAEQYAVKAMTYQGSRGAEKSRILRTDLLSPRLNLSANAVQLPFRPFALRVEEKNCAGFDYEIYRLDAKETMAYQACRSMEKYANSLEFSKKQTLTGRIDLPADKEDLLLHSGTVALPALVPGFYLLKTKSQDIRYKGIDSTFPAPVLSSSLFFQVSETGFLCYPDGPDRWNGYVTNRENGLPLSSVGVDAYFIDYDYESRSNLLRHRYHTETDKNGFFRIDSSAMQSDERYTRLILRFSGKSDTLWFEKNRFITLNAPYQESPRTTRNSWDDVQDIFFFDNLPVYRPGDSLLLKALIVMKQNDSSFMANPEFPGPLSVYLRDPDGETRANLQCTVNRNGIARIALRIPPEAKAGQWYLQTARNIASCPVEVENYKRPSFFVDFPEVPSVSGKDTCRVDGLAHYYNGEPVGHATANYRIYKSAFPLWRNPAAKIRHVTRELLGQGRVHTDENGKFTVRFPAEHYASATEYSLTYEIECDLTDRNGETQTASLRIPIRTMPVLTAEVPERTVTDGKRFIHTSGTFRFAIDGTDCDSVWNHMQTRIRFFRLSDTLESSPYAPGLNQVFPEQIRTAYYWDEHRFRENLPTEPYFDLQTRDSLAVFTPVRTAELTKDGTYTLPADLPAGCYEYRLGVRTPDNDTLHHIGRFYVVRIGSPVPSGMGRDGFFLVADTVSGISSRNARIELIAGNPGRESVHILFRTEDAGGKSREYAETIPPGIHRITLPADKLGSNGNWSVNAFSYSGNRTFSHSVVIDIPKEEKNLEIHCPDLPASVESGKPVHLHFRIGSDYRQGVPGPLILGMYDASLDVFSRPNLVWPVSASYLNGKAAYGPSVLLPGFPYPQNRWNASISGNERVYGITANPAPVPLLYSGLSDFGDFGARLRWKASSGSRFGKKTFFLQNEAAVDKALPMAGIDVALRKTAQADEKQTPMAAEAGKGRKQELPRRNFRPDVFFTLAEWSPADSGYRADFRFTAPDYFGKFKLRAFGYTDRLYAGYFQQEITVNKPIMLYPQLPRFLRERDFLTLKCRFTASRDEFPKTDNLQAAILTRITAIDADGRASVLTERLQMLTIPNGQGHTQTKIRIPENTGKLAVEYRINLTDSLSGNVLATDAVTDTVLVLENRMRVDEFLPFSIRRGETRTLKSAFSLPLDSLKFVFSGDPGRVIAGSLQEIAFDSCKTSLDAVLKMTGWYFAGKDWRSVWPVLWGFAAKDGGFSWLKDRPGDYAMTLRIMMALSDLPQEELLKLPDMRAKAQKALYFLFSRLQENFLQDTAGNYRITRDKIACLYLFSAWKPLSSSFLKQPVCLYYEQAASAYATETELGDQALLLRYFLTENRLPEAEKIRANLDRLALYDKEWGMYWKRERLGSAPGIRIRNMAGIARAYLDFACGTASSHPRRSDTLATQYREILNWMLGMQQSVDFRTGNGSGITTADLIAQAAAFMPSKSIPARISQHLFSSIPGKTGTAIVRIGKNRIETDSAAFSFVACGQQAESFRNKTQITWPLPAERSDPGNRQQGQNLLTEQNKGRGSEKDAKNRPENVFSFSSPQIGYGSLTASRRQDMATVKPQQDNGGLMIKRTYRDLDNADGREILSETGITTTMGSRVRVRLELQADRDFSYVHLRSLRPAGLEWTGTQSGYEYGNGIFYYKDIDDQGVDFFIEFLPKGRYLLHYELKADTEGVFTDGPATVKSDFHSGSGSHSGSGRIQVVPLLR